MTGVRVTGSSSIRARRRDRGSGAVLVVEADEAYRAVIETCVHLADCRTEATTDLTAALARRCDGRRTCATGLTGGLAWPCCRPVPCAACARGMAFGWAGGRARRGRHTPGPPCGASAGRRRRA